MGGDTARCSLYVGLVLRQIMGAGEHAAGLGLAPALPWHWQRLEEGPGCREPLVPREVWLKASSSCKGCAGPVGAARRSSAPTAVDALEQLEILRVHFWLLQ